MKGFFKYTLATVVGLILFSIISTFIFFGIIGAIASSSQNKESSIEANTILMLELDKKIVDRTSNNPFDGLNLAGLQGNQPIGLIDILNSIEKAKKDPNISGIYLKLRYIPAGIATIDEIRNALLDFKESGKFIYAYADDFTQSAYYLATVADKIYMNPEGSIAIRGLRANSVFFKGALEKIGIEPLVFRYGKFKSAVEPFITDKMSDANREQTSTYVNSIWNHIVNGIATQRHLTSEAINTLADGYLVRDAKSAYDNKMIDGLKYKDELIAELDSLTNAKNEKDLKVVSLGSYKNVSIEEKSKKRDKRSKIAVVYASGDVVMGKGEKGEMGAETIAKALREVRNDSTIKAIVFRVNSPGGSALASDIIWREVDLAQKAKPLIVSMGDLAASGGYYISCPARKIVASEVTLTGSIGVFGLMFNTQELMNKKLGITFDGVSTNTYSDLGNSNREMSSAEKEIIQEGVVDVYKTFIDHVGRGRSMTTDAVDSIGQGRVWSGANAKEIGLVDEFGGLKKAISIAAQEAGLDDYKTVDYPEFPDPIEQLLKELTGQAKIKIMQHELGTNFELYQYVNKALQTQGVQARMPYNIELY